MQAIHFVQNCGWQWLCGYRITNERLEVPTGDRHYRYTLRPRLGHRGNVHRSRFSSWCIAEVDRDVRIVRVLVGGVLGRHPGTS